MVVQQTVRRALQPVALALGRGHRRQHLARGGLVLLRAEAGEDAEAGAEAQTVVAGAKDWLARLAVEAPTYKGLWKSAVKHAQCLRAEKAPVVAWRTGE